jgi:hypothetical protein
MEANNMGKTPIGDGAPERLGIDLSLGSLISCRQQIPKPYIVKPVKRHGHSPRFLMRNPESRWPRVTEDMAMSSSKMKLIDLVDISKTLRMQDTETNYLFSLSSMAVRELRSAMYVTVPP